MLKIIGETNDRWWRCNRDKYGRRKKYGRWTNKTGTLKI
jgi:hypothetical protein